MKSIKFCLCCFFIFLLPFSLLSQISKNNFWLDEIDLTKVFQGWSLPKKNMNMAEKPISLDGIIYERGLGTHAESVIYMNLLQNVKNFSGVVGLDDKVKNLGGRSVQFSIKADHKLVWKSSIIKPGAKSESFKIDLIGVKILELYVLAPEYDTWHTHGDWANAKFELIDPNKKPFSFLREREKEVILTPKAPLTPRLNGAKVVGSKIGSSFFFKLAVSGQRPIKYQAQNLPSGFVIDENTGMITGKSLIRAENKVDITLTNAFGTIKDQIIIKIGDQLALTPPMGWNSWNCWGMEIDEQKIKNAADCMVSTSLADYGWSYINADDGWQKTRDTASGNIISDLEKFPDMKGLCDYIHNKGLKAGLYSSPGRLTCGQKPGSYLFEQRDIQKYASWGYDYLKYDWCTYHEVGTMTPNLQQAQHPYFLMRDAFKTVKRDIVYSLCQYGMQNVWEWGPKANAQLWRSTNDITDTWLSMMSIIDRQAGLSKYAKPGNWNDPDMLVLGQLGWSGKTHPTKLTPNEQYYHMSMWAILSAPLLLGCDLSKLDAFTLSLLTNNEVIAINQDPLGNQADKIVSTESYEIWTKKMQDGSTIIGVFNKETTDMKIEIPFEKLGLIGKIKLRNVWRQKDLGLFEKYNSIVPLHGVVLYQAK